MLTRDRADRERPKSSPLAESERHDGLVRTDRTLVPFDAEGAASSGNRRKACRLSLRGSRRLNHMIHMAAVTQADCKHSDGHAYYQRKLAEGKTPAEARRALKRKISNFIYARLQADARTRGSGPGRATGERQCFQRGCTGG
jgi:Transposase IS116/IS110/IS902 family